MKLALAAAALAAATMTFGVASAETTVIKKHRGPHGSRVTVIEKHRMHRHGPRIMVRDHHRHHGARVVIKHREM